MLFGCIHHVPSYSIFVNSSDHSYTVSCIGVYRLLSFSLIFKDNYDDFGSIWAIKLISFGGNRFTILNL